MRHFAITSKGSLEAVQWPPRWYYYDLSIYPETQELQNASWLKMTNTELRNWSPIAVSAAWLSYTRDMGVEGMPIPKHRDMFFSAYLYAKQELDFSRRKLDELNHLWSKAEQS